MRERGNGSHVWLSAFWDAGSEQMALTSSTLPLALLCCKEVFIHLCVCVNTDVCQELFFEDFGSVYYPKLTLCSFKVHMPV